MTINAVMIDSREPEWVQKLNFGGETPTAVIQLDYGDVHAVTDDGHTLLIERKTTDDLLGSLADERLFPQCQRLAQPRIDQILAGQPATYWPYLVICGIWQCNSNGQVITERGETGWNWISIQGALLSIQEMGVMVVHASSNQMFEKTVINLGKRKRENLQQFLPPRPAVMLGYGAALLASLPGIGPERLNEIMQWSGNIPAHALAGLTDLSIPAPVGEAVRRKIRSVLGLKDNQNLEIVFNKQNQEILAIYERSEVNV
jgi:ERCC4-type nuclease